MHTQQNFTCRKSSQDYWSSERHNNKIPPIKLTNNNAQTLSPVPTGSLFFILLQIDIVIGKHQARGSKSQPDATQPKIRKNLAATAKPSLPPLPIFTVCSTRQPQPVHITASSAISFPHFEQNFINCHPIKYFVEIDVFIISLLRIKDNAFEVIVMQFRHLREIREDNDIKQKDIAKYLNVSQNTYSQYETGVISLTAEVLIKRNKYFTRT